jgi:hypothetical protein
VDGIADRHWTRRRPDDLRIFYTRQGDHRSSTLKENLPRIRPKRLVLTHMGEAMLAQRAQAGHPTAEDGMVVEV